MYTLHEREGEYVEDAKITIYMGQTLSHPMTYSEVLDSGEVEGV